jgi:hypothetical protein
MDDETPNRPATPHQIFGVALALVIILVPLFLIVVFQENSIVAALLGRGRILGFWVVATILVIVFRRKIDASISNWESRRSRLEN